MRRHSIKNGTKHPMDEITSSQYLYFISLVNTVMRLNLNEELKGLFVWKWNKVDENLWRENRKKKKKLKCVWLGGERKIIMGVKCFLLRSTKKFSLPNREKTERGSHELPKIPLMLEFTYPNLQSVTPFFPLFLFIFFFFFPLFLCY